MTGRTALPRARRGAAPRSHQQPPEPNGGTTGGELPGSLEEALLLLHATDDPVLRGVSIPLSWASNASGKLHRCYTYTAGEGVRIQSYDGGATPAQVLESFGCSPHPPPPAGVGSGSSPNSTPPQDGGAARAAEADTSPTSAITCDSASGGSGDAGGCSMGGGVGVGVGASNTLDVVAVFTTTTPQLSMEYFGEERLRFFLGSARPPGILQRYRARGASHSISQAIWTPYLLVVEKRANTNRVKDTSLPVEARFSTSAQSRLSAQRPVPLLSQRVVGEVLQRISAAFLPRLGVRAVRVVAYFNSLQPLQLCAVSSVELPPRGAERRPKQTISQRFYNKGYYPGSSSSGENTRGSHSPGGTSHLPPGGEPACAPPPSPDATHPDIYDSTLRESARCGGGGGGDGGDAGNAIPPPPPQEIRASVPVPAGALRGVPHHASDMLVCATPDPRDAPDSFLLYDVGCGEGPSRPGGAIPTTYREGESHPPLPSQKKQVYATLRALRNAGGGGLGTPFRGGAGETPSLHSPEGAARSRPPLGGASQGKKRLNPRGVGSGAKGGGGGKQGGHPFNEPCSFGGEDEEGGVVGTADPVVRCATVGSTSFGMLQLRKKYGPYAIDNILVGDTKPVVVTCGDVDMLPKPTRGHIVHDTTVVGAASPETFRTRPATAPHSKLLSYLQEMGVADVPTSLQEISVKTPSRHHLAYALQRIERRKVVSMREKLKHAIPSLEIGVDSPHYSRELFPQHVLEEMRQAAKRGRGDIPWDRSVSTQPGGGNSAPPGLPHTIHANKGYPAYYGDSENPTAVPLDPPGMMSQPHPTGGRGGGDNPRGGGTPHHTSRRSPPLPPEPTPQLHRGGGGGGSPQQAMPGDTAALLRYAELQRRRARDVSPVGHTPPPPPGVEGEDGFSSASSCSPVSQCSLSPERGVPLHLKGLRVVPKAPLLDTSNMHQSVSELLRRKGDRKARAASRRRDSRQKKDDALLLSSDGFYVAQPVVRGGRGGGAAHNHRSFDFLTALFGSGAPLMESGDGAGVPGSTAGDIPQEKDGGDPQRIEADEQSATERRRILEITMGRAKLRHGVAAVFAMAQADLSLLVVEDFLYTSYSHGLSAQARRNRGGWRAQQGAASGGTEGGSQAGAVCTFEPPAELHGTMFHTHSLLLHLGFNHVVPEEEDSDGGEDAGGSDRGGGGGGGGGAFGWYCLPDVAVTIAGAMADLQGVRDLLHAVAESTDPDVSQRLRGLVVAEGGGGGGGGGDAPMPLYEAVQQVAAEFTLDVRRWEEGAG